MMTFALISTSAFAQANLDELSKVTFTCSAAALNAASSEVAKVETFGNYYFASFVEVNGGASYSAVVGFRSNVQGEPAVNFQVQLYCQQGHDPYSKLKITRL